MKHLKKSINERVMLENEAIHFKFWEINTDIYLYIE